MIKLRVLLNNWVGLSFKINYFKCPYAKTLCLHFGIAHSRYFSMRLLLFILWLLHPLPLPVLGRIGKFLGMLAYYITKERKHIALTNLRYCFPDLSEEEVKKRAKTHFQYYGRSVFDRAVLWWAPVERIKRLIVVEPAFPVEEIQANPVIFLCPHFICLEIPGALISMHAKACSIYSHQSNKILDEVLRKGRLRFNDEGELYSRQEGIKPIVRALRKRVPFLIFPDMDLGLKESEFFSFFGHPAATLTAPARLAEITGAKIIPAVATFLPNYQGWKVKFYPAWDHLPKDDIKAITQYMNHFVEERIREAPAEYYWTHRRFKNRPEGEPSIYRKN